MHCFIRHEFGPVTAYELGFAPIGRPLKTVYLYLIGSLVIDTGQHHMQKYVRQAVSSEPIDAVLLSHFHEDHSGNAALIKEMHGAEVYAHPYGGRKLASGFDILPYQKLLFGKASPLETSPFPEKIQTGDYTLEVIHSPGHSKDHTVFFERQNGWLFSGDLYIGEKIQFFRSDEKIADQIDSLKKISQLDFDTIFCGHRPALENGKAKLLRKLHFLQDFHCRTGELAALGCSEREIIKTMRVKGDLPIRVFTMGNASFSHMVKSSLEAHRLRR